MSRTRLWLTSLRALAIGAGVVAGFAHDGVVGAALGGLACVGVIAIVEARAGGDRSGEWSPAERAPHEPGSSERNAPAPGSTEQRSPESDQTALPADVDRRLAELAHALRSPIAAATAAFAAFDERVGERPGDEETAFFRGVVQRNLEEARERLLQLEEHRLAHRPAAHAGRPATPAAAHTGRR